VLSATEGAGLEDRRQPPVQAEEMHPPGRREVQLGIGAQARDRRCEPGQDVRIHAGGRHVADERAGRQIGSEGAVVAIERLQDVEQLADGFFAVARVTVVFEKLQRNRHGAAP
jgi:hypothetical protein